MKLKVRAGWLLSGIAALIFGVWAIIGPGVDIVKLDELEGPVDGYGEVSLENIDKIIKELQQKVRELENGK
jgi:hypothetical protein